MAVCAWASMLCGSGGFACSVTFVAVMVATRVLQQSIPLYVSAHSLGTVVVPWAVTYSLWRGQHLPNGHSIAVKGGYQRRTYGLALSSQVNSCRTVTSKVVWLNLIHVAGMSIGLVKSALQSYHVSLVPFHVQAISSPDGRHLMVKSIRGMLIST